MRAHQPEEFLALLEAGPLPDPQGVSVVGQVKAQDGALWLSAGLSCERWLPLPTDAVASITHLRNVSCGDHTHPLVRVTFDAADGPQTAGLDGAALVADCVVVNTGSGLEVCCPVTNPDGSVTFECTGIV